MSIIYQGKHTHIPDACTCCTTPFALFHLSTSPRSFHPSILPIRRSIKSCFLPDFDNEMRHSSLIPLTRCLSLSTVLRRMPARQDYVPDAHQNFVVRKSSMDAAHLKINPRISASHWDCSLPPSRTVRGRRETKLLRLRKLQDQTTAGSREVP